MIARYSRVEVDVERVEELVAKGADALEEMLQERRWTIERLGVWAGVTAAEAAARLTLERCEDQPGVEDQQRLRIMALLILAADARRTSVRLAVN